LTDVSFMRASPEFSDADKQQLATLMPHLQTALALHRRVAASDAGRREALRSFDRARQPLAVLDRMGCVLHLNESARMVLDKADGVSLKFGRLLFDSVLVQGEFERAVRITLEALGTADDVPPQKVRVPRSNGTRPLALNVVPVQRPDSVALMPEGAGCMVLIYDDGALNQLPIDRLAWLYRLTAAEARICEGLYSTGSVESAAQVLCLTRHTVRSHLKSIYSKFGVATQGQLMQQLANSIRLSDAVEPRVASDGSRSGEA
jgi:DNA-binding CsgD family transcriptional regulator